MKKVLTLVSALSMVAGSAFAHDYSWSVDKTPSTDKYGVVENTKGMLKYDGKKFTFIANADDVVTVDVNNSNATSTMIVVIGGVKNEVKEGTAVKLTQKVNAIMERIEALVGNLEDGSNPFNNPSTKYILSSIDNLINDATDFAKANIGNFSDIKKS